MPKERERGCEVGTGPGRSPANGSRVKRKGEFPEKTCTAGGGSKMVGGKAGGESIAYGQINKDMSTVPAGGRRSSPKRWRRTRKAAFC